MALIKKTLKYSKFLIFLNLIKLANFVKNLLIIQLKT